jgi:serine/threonine protein kinase
MSHSTGTPPYPQPGEVIDGKYKIERTLGQGGMGAVVRAYHMLLRAPVALKFMNPQYIELPGAVDRFLNEGVASKAIASDHVLTVDDVGKLPSGAPYLVMDCLDGRDLAKVLEDEGKPGISATRAVYFVIQILRALQAAHATNIVHRDMKPSNCFVIQKDGDPDFVKILDFGISKIQTPGSAALTQTHSALGTPLYMSPEQARSPKEVDGRSDLYSVSVILYELISGRTPFTADSGQLTELLFKLFTADPDPLDELVPDLPPGLAAVVHKGLTREPINRYSSALLMAEALEPFTDEKGLALISRMRAFIAPEDPGKHSRAMPPSAVAFSELGKGHSVPPAVLGMAATQAEPPRTATIPQNRAPSVPPTGPSATVAMPNRPESSGSTPPQAPVPPQEFANLTHPRPHGPSASDAPAEGRSNASSSPALASTRPERTDGDAAKSPVKLLVTGAGIALAAVVIAILVTRVSSPPATLPVSDPSKAANPPSTATTGGTSMGAVLPPVGSNSASATVPSASASTATATGVPGPTAPPTVRAPGTAPASAITSSKPVSSAARAIKQDVIQ